MNAVRVARFGAGALAQLPEVCEALGVRKPLLVTTPRGATAAGG